MGYLDLGVLADLSGEAFRQQRPYPWVNIPNTLTADGFVRLRAALPDASRFERILYPKTPYGGVGHDRLSLHYQRKMPIGDTWEEFLAELRGPAYASFIRRMYGIPQSQRMLLTFEWYYAWQGCAVSPHCDARRKLGTHIFYFNTEEEWDPAWGGQILIMDDDGKRDRHSGPDFKDLKIAASLDARGNGSLMFRRTPHSWHGVYPLHSSPDCLRRIFIVTVNLPSLQVFWRWVRGKDPDGYPWVFRKAA